LASLTLTDGTATLAEGTDKVLVLGALSINLDAATLDLQNNGLIVNYSGTSPLATLTGYIASAYTTVGATHWQGTGLTSSWAAYDPAGATGLGIIENHQGGSNAYSTFLGESVGSSSILIRYTHDGDANLDGKVDGGEIALTSTE
jgi:hypothetical protein